MYFGPTNDGIADDPLFRLLLAHCSLAAYRKRRDSITGVNLKQDFSGASNKVANTSYPDLNLWEGLNEIEKEFNKKRIDEEIDRYLNRDYGMMMYFKIPF